MKNFPDGMRPIAARLLKSVIDTLRPELANQRILDLFAGQGRFGFQCLIEGAESVTFVEKDRRMVNELKKTASSGRNKSYSAKILQCDAFKFLETTDLTFEIVFADPPFSDWDSPWQEKFFSAVLRALKPKGILLVKCPSQMIVSSEFKGLTLWKETEVGESKVLYYTYGKEEPHTD